MSVTRPTSLSEADLASTTDILVEAFWPDVAMQAMAAFDKGVLGYMMRKRLEAALTINAALIYRASPAASTGSSGADEGEGEIIGVLTINPPGLDHSAVGIWEALSRRKSYATDQPFMDHISQDIKDWLNNSYYPWFAKWSGETFGPTGLGDSLYINLVAVRSDQRRRGVGKKLMRAALEQAEGEGVEVTLLSHEEENRNRKGELIKKTAYYTSLGFKTVGYATLTIKDTETRWWGMQRPPAAKSAEYA